MRQIFGSRAYFASARTRQRVESGAGHETVDLFAGRPKGYGVLYDLFC
jgi:hypothetical protein